MGYVFLEKINSNLCTEKLIEHSMVTVVVFCFYYFCWFWNLHRTRQTLNTNKHNGTTTGIERKFKAWSRHKKRKKEKNCVHIFRVSWHALHSTWRTNTKLSFLYLDSECVCGVCVLVCINVYALVATFLIAAAFYVFCSVASVQWNINLFIIELTAFFGKFN